MEWAFSLSVETPIMSEISRIQAGKWPICPLLRSNRTLLLDTSRRMTYSNIDSGVGCWFPSRFHTPACRGFNSHPRHHLGDSSSGPGCRPFTPVTRVRTPHPLPTGRWSNGMTQGSDPWNPGSSPGRPSRGAQVSTAWGEITSNRMGVRLPRPPPATIPA